MRICLAVAITNAAPAAEALDRTEVPEEWAPVIDDLRADDFSARENAGARLSELGMDALPWLDVALAEAGDGDPEFVRRLAAIALSIRERVAREGLEKGMQVSIDLKDVGPGEILDALHESMPRPAIFGDADKVFGERADEKGDFVFEGSFWEGVDELFGGFPPEGADDAGRESFDEEHDLLRWNENDLAAAAQPSGSAGVLRVRAARTALENSNGKDYFTVTLIPKLEPAYLPDEVSLLLKEIQFAGGKALEPGKRLLRFERSGYRMDTDFQPENDFTWEVELTEGIDQSGPVSLDLSMQVKARRVEWIKRPLPALGASVDFTNEISLTVEELDEDSAKLKFEGEEGTRIDFNQYSRNGTLRLFDILDADGKPIKFNIRGSSSGSGGDSWHQSFNCKFSEGKPVTVRALLPGKAETVRQSFVIEGVPVPGMAK